MSPSDQLADPPDSTCALVIHPKPETFCNDWVPMTANRECKGQEELAGITNFILIFVSTKHSIFWHYD